VLAQIDALASGQTSVGEVIVRLVEADDKLPRPMISQMISMSHACDSRS